MKRILIVSLLLWALLVVGACAEGETALEGFLSAAELESDDVCAWLEIPGTEISYPVMQSSEDDSFYLNHNAYGTEDQNGALYTQSAYNAPDFTNPVTVVYGHRMNSGAMFGNLQMHYSGKDAFDAHRQIRLHLPEETLEYTVFAAIPYSRVHILHYYDFARQRVYERFIDEVYSVRSLIAIADEEARPEYGERLLILSTCVKGDESQRFLVLAVLNEGN